MSIRWDASSGRYIDVPDYGPDHSSDSEIFLEPQPPPPGDIPITITDQLRLKFSFDSYKDKMDLMNDDNYFLDAGRVLPIIEELIQMAGVVEQLLNCCAEFSKDIVCCSEYFQAADEKIDTLRKKVGPR